MKSDMRATAEKIVLAAIRANLPGPAVRNALRTFHPGSGRLFVIAVGKAAWEMANAAREQLGSRISSGTVLTKYGHCISPIPGFEQYEAGHPLPDMQGIRATESILHRISGLSPEDTVLLLVSGGASALFEKPLLPLDSLIRITENLLRCGASITEINTIRKHLSAVKGGRFAELCFPAHVHSLILSDVLGNDLSSIASGPAVPDPTTVDDVRNILRKYPQVSIPESARHALEQETPKNLRNISFEVIGSVRHLCHSAAAACLENGYRPVILNTDVSCEAKDAGKTLGSIAKAHRKLTSPSAFLIGGETVVHVSGSGLGGRNQEIALASAESLSGLDNVCVISVGSDGTDGPTDAAGGFADGKTVSKLKEKGLSITDVLQENDSYHALQAIGNLVTTGPTGTNVNDISIVLIRPE